MRMLIVENDMIVTKIWKRFFEREFEVFTAYQTAEAIEVIQENGCPDIVLLDLRLNGPKSTGMIVYDYIRTELNSKIPILFITGLEAGVDLYIKAAAATKQDVSKGLFTQIIKKPVSIKVLTQIIHENIHKDGDFLSTSFVS